LQLTGGERTTGAIYTVLAGTLLAYAMLASGVETAALRRSAPLIVWLAVFACTLVLWRALALQETRFIQRSTALVAADARGQLERDLYARIDGVERLAERSLAYTDPEAWKRDAAGLLKGVASVDTVALGGPDYVIRQAVPATARRVANELRRRKDPLPAPARCDARVCRGCDSSLACAASPEKCGGEATHVGRAARSVESIPPAECRFEAGSPALWHPTCQSYWSGPCAAWPLADYTAWGGGPSAPSHRPANCSYH